MHISVSKTKILAVEGQSKDQQAREQPTITLQGQALQLEEVKSLLSSEVGPSSKVEKEVAGGLRKLAKCTKCGGGKSSGAGTLRRPPNCRPSRQW